MDLIFKPPWTASARKRRAKSKGTEREPQWRERQLQERTFSFPRVFGLIRSPGSIEAQT
jgi:hypothetical protein